MRINLANPLKKSIDQNSALSVLNVFYNILNPGYISIWELNRFVYILLIICTTSCNRITIYLFDKKIQKIENLAIRKSQIYS